MKTLSWIDEGTFNANEDAFIGKRLFHSLQNIFNLCLDLALPLHNFAPSNQKWEKYNGIKEIFRIDVGS